MRFLRYVILFLTLGMLGGCAVQPVNIDFENLQRPSSPNYFLACPEGDYCNLKPGQIVPIYPVDVSTLKADFMRMLDDQPRITELSKDSQIDQYQWIQRSLVFRFPDIITVRFYAVDDHQSTLAIFSHAKYGYSDFDVNQNRISRWLKMLDDQVTQAE